MRYLDKPRLLHDDVLTYDADVCNTVSDVARDVVVTKEVEIERKIVGRRVEALAAFLKTDPDLVEQLHGTLAQPAGILQRKSKPFVGHVGAVCPSLMES
jgi:hypothetical protein